MVKQVFWKIKSDEEINLLTDEQVTKLDDFNLAEILWNIDLDELQQAIEYINLNLDTLQNLSIDWIAWLRDALNQLEEWLTNVKAKTDKITVTWNVNLDTLLTDVNTLKTNVYNLDLSTINDDVAWIKAKTDKITVTDNVNLDNMQTAIETLSTTVNNLDLEAVNTALEWKADKSTTYTKTETDTLLNAKANTSDINTSLEWKADKSTTYTKTETDNLLNNKVNTSNIKNLTNLATKSELPTKTSDLTNDSWFVTNDWVQDIILEELNQFDKLDYEVVTTLPTTWETWKRYLVKVEWEDKYNEYIYTNNKWNNIGTTWNIDLSDYYTKTEVDAMPKSPYNEDWFIDVFWDWSVLTSEPPIKFIADTNISKILFPVYSINFGDTIWKNNCSKINASALNTNVNISYFTPYANNNHTYTFKWISFWVFNMKSWSTYKFKFNLTDANNNVVWESDEITRTYYWDMFSDRVQNINDSISNPQFTYSNVQFMIDDEVIPHSWIELTKWTRYNFNIKFTSWNMSSHEMYMTRTYLYRSEKADYTLISWTNQIYEQYNKVWLTLNEVVEWEEVYVALWWIIKYRNNPNEEYKIVRYTPWEWLFNYYEWDTYNINSTNEQWLVNAWAKITIPNPFKTDKFEHIKLNNSRYIIRWDSYVSEPDSESYSCSLLNVNIKFYENLIDKCILHNDERFILRVDRYYI